MIPPYLFFSCNSDFIHRDTSLTLTSKRYNTFTAIFIICFFLLFLISCNRPQKPLFNRVDSSIITIPQPALLDKEVEKKLSNGCRLWYDTYLKSSGFNGGILVAKNGNIIFEQYKGMAHLGGNDTIKANTPLHIASVSKTFTAMAILKLAQDGKLNIDDTLTKYFPSFNYPGITIKNLLSHRSGLPNYLYFMEDLGWNKSDYIKNQDVLDYLIKRKAEIKNIGLPNRSFNYCNTNYVLLALLVEKITGIPFPEYMHKTYFEPLQMRNTFIFTIAESGKITPSYDWRGREIPINFLDEAYGDKNIYTTPRDLLIWDRALTGSALFNAATLNLAFTPYSNERPGIKNYGLGWRMNLYPTGKKMIFHNGWWHGSNAVFIRLIEEDATIIVIGNRYTNAVYKARHLANLFNYYFDGPSEEEVDSLNQDVHTPPIP